MMPIKFVANQTILRLSRSCSLSVSVRKTISGHTVVLRLKTASRLQCLKRTGHTSGQEIRRLSV